MITKRHLLLSLLVAAILSSCGTKKAWYSESAQHWKEKVDNMAIPMYTVFLVGDAGNPSADPKEPTLVQLHEDIMMAGPESAVVFLGDNIYRFGLPDSTDKGYAEAKRRIDAQIEVGGEYTNKYFIPGNHDWNMSKKGGWDAVKRQEEYVEKKLGSNNFLPSYGCPGPEAVELGLDVLLIIIDSEWWLHKHEKPQGDDCKCRSCDDSSFVANLNFLIEQNEDKKIIIAGHHPVYTRGSHGGKFPWHDHVFPLRMASKFMVLPLPILGSLHPVARQLGVSRQDITNKRNKEFREVLMAVAKKREGLIFAAGHEHALQYFEVDDDHWLVSGSGCKTSFVRRGGDATFLNSEKGYMKISIFPDETILEIRAFPKGKEKGEVVFQKKL